MNRVLQTIRTLILDFINIFYPDYCLFCHNTLYGHEKYLCLKCSYELPKTDFANHKENPISQLFWGKLVLENATSVYRFSKNGRIQKVVHAFKYKGKKEVALEFGKHIGICLAESPHFTDIDIIIPIPLHYKKERKRGYNQSEWLAKGVSDIMKIKVDTRSIVRTVETQTQTKKSKSERWDNVRSVFSVQDAKSLEGKHILLIDDVITTGSTIEACAAALLDVPATRVSVASLAYASDS